MPRGNTSLQSPHSRVIEFRFRPSSAVRVRMQDGFLLLGRCDHLTDDEFFKATERMALQWAI